MCWWLLSVVEFGTSVVVGTIAGWVTRGVVSELVMVVDGGNRVCAGNVVGA